MQKIVWIPLMLVSFPVASGYAVDWVQECVEPSRIHCPCHPNHCEFIGPLRLGSEVTGKFAIAQNGTKLYYPPSNITLNSSAVIIVALELTNSTPGVFHNVTLRVDPTPGLNFTGNTTHTFSMTNGTTANATFPFRLAAVWPEGDHIFPRFNLSGNGTWIDGYAAIVAREPTPPSPTPPPTPPPTSTSPAATTSTTTPPPTGPATTPSPTPAWGLAVLIAAIAAAALVLAPARRRP